ncbi:hypothetical protein LWI29_011419 [Acer saccharum]|uniref:Uncharacterized protein n=1 Tax=Acer saccharum TaxID=4024 RepID=A0AA39TNC4_ACESA|nr:hypothetical protein LWI29_011419 [Acer saccharum]
MLINQYNIIKHNTQCLDPSVYICSETGKGAGIVGQGMIIALQGDQDLSPDLLLHVMRGTTGQTRDPQVQERMVGVPMKREIMHPAGRGVLGVIVAVLQGLVRDPTALANGVVILVPVGSYC